MWWWFGTVAIVSLIGIPLIIGAIARANRKVGQATQMAADQAAVINAGERIVDAQNAAPDNRGDLVERLRRKGGL